jgi:murein DD-endopeptidase MepM/ murein hydrolase activator NlpD
MMRSSGLITILLVFLVIGGFGYVVYDNADKQQTPNIRAIIPTQAPPTPNPDPLSEIFSSGFGGNATPLPTIAIPITQYTAPTIAPMGNVSEQPISPQDLASRDISTIAPISMASTPTPIPATPTIPVGSDSTTTDQDLSSVRTMNTFEEQTSDDWRPPSMPVPLNRDPLGRDHYIFSRPIDSNATDYGLFYYPYGTGEMPLGGLSRVHHGIDLSNPIGTPVRAAGSGTVIFSSQHPEDYFPGSASYGVAVVIEHDFVWNNQVIWTLYAHLDQTRVQAGDRVEMGDIIALSGNTGRSTGPHLHFEVRIGAEAPLGYGDTQNPYLWMAPYYGHGTLAGRFITERGNLLDAETITLRNIETGRVYTTKTYTFDGTINQIKNDPVWGENFVIGDLPQGRYVVFVEYNSQRYSETVTIYEGMTTFIELLPVTVATPQPVETNTP